MDQNQNTVDSYHVTKLVGDHTKRKASKNAPGKSSAIAAPFCAGSPVQITDKIKQSPRNKEREVGI